jgi:hypothetical protein
MMLACASFLIASGLMVTVPPGSSDLRSIVRNNVKPFSRWTTVTICGATGCWSLTILTRAWRIVVAGRRFSVFGFAVGAGVCGWPGAAGIGGAPSGVCAAAVNAKDAINTVANMNNKADFKALLISRTTKLD